MKRSLPASPLAGFRKGLRDGTVSLPLPFALVASLLAHAVVLSVTFSDLPRQPNVKDRGLEVVLVNARRERAPDQADVLAQADLDGGGVASEEARPSTPAPPNPIAQDGDSPLDMRRAPTLTAPPPTPETHPPAPAPAAIAAVPPSLPAPEAPRSTQTPPAPVSLPTPVAKPEPATPPEPPLASEPLPAPEAEPLPETTPTTPTRPGTTFIADLQPLPAPAADQPESRERVSMALAPPEPARETTPEVLSAERRPQRPAEAVDPATSQPPAAQPSAAAGTQPAPESSNAVQPPAEVPPVAEPPTDAAPSPTPEPATSPPDAAQPVPSAPPAPAPPVAEATPIPAPQPPPAPASREPAPPSIAALPPAPAAEPSPALPEAPQLAPAPEVSGADLLDSIAAIARLEAQIDRRLDEYSKRPRKVQIGARAREHRFALYVEDWRQKVERIGTLNYPEAARGRLYGNLVLTVTIRADGTLEDVKVERSSGHEVLDRAAEQIVRMAAPYAPFPPDIRVDTDIIEITRTWTFTNSDQLRTR